MPLAEFTQVRISLPPILTPSVIYELKTRVVPPSIERPSISETLSESRPF